MPPPSHTQELTVDEGFVNGLMSYIGQSSRMQLTAQLARSQGVRVRVSGNLKPPPGQRVPTVNELIKQFAARHELDPEEEVEQYNGIPDQGRRADFNHRKLINLPPIGQEGGGEDSKPGSRKASRGSSRATMNSWRTFQSLRESEKHSSTTSPGVPNDGLQKPGVPNGGGEDDFRGRGRRVRDDRRGDEQTSEAREKRRSKNVDKTSQAANVKPLRDKQDDSLHMNGFSHPLPEDERVPAIPTIGSQGSTDNTPVSTPTSGNARRLNPLRDRGTREPPSSRLRQGSDREREELVATGTVWSQTSREKGNSRNIPSTSSSSSTSHNSANLPARQTDRSQRSVTFPAASDTATTLDGSEAKSVGLTNGSSSQSSGQAMLASHPTSRRSQQVSQSYSSGSVSGARGPVSLAGGVRGRGQAKDAEPRYADPFSSAPSSYQQRLAELSSLEADTVRNERMRRVKKKQPKQELY